MAWGASIRRHRRNRHLSDGVAVPRLPGTRAREAHVSTQLLLGGGCMVIKCKG